MEFSGKVALVTGGGSGVGEATARKLAAEGAAVGVLDLRADRVDTAVASIADGGGQAIPLTANVADEAQMRAAIGRLVAATGRIDIVIANAGINGMWAPIDELTPAEFDTSVAVNFRGTYLTLHLGVPHLKAAGGGAIVVTSSINGTRLHSTGGASIYSATKAAQAAMATQLALELARYKIRVNTIAPGQTKTNISENTWRRNIEAARVPVVFPEGDIPLTGAPADPDDIADAIVMLCSDRSRHITGALLHVDGGQSLIR